MTIRALEKEINIEGYVKVVKYNEDLGGNEVVCEVEDWRYDRPEKILSKKVKYMYPATDVKYGNSVGALVLEIA